MDRTDRFGAFHQRADLVAHFRASIHHRSPTRDAPARPRNGVSLLASDTPARHRQKASCLSDRWSLEIGNSER